MPTYDYQCRSCGEVTEVIHAMTDEGPSVCERCGGSLRRVLYPAGIIFKGSGFYRTDSRAASTSSDGSGAGAPGSPKKPSSTPSASESGGSGATGSSGPATSSGSTSGGESAA